MSPTRDNFILVGGCCPHPLSPLHWNFPQRGKTQNRAVEKNKAKIKANALHSNEEWLSLGLSL